MKIFIKRVYEDPSPADGHRILVDRLWPRGLSKAKAKIDYWTTDFSPSSELRRWYRHDPAKWEEFKRRYFEELDESKDAVAKLRKIIASGSVTFLYSSKETNLNNARALKEYLDGH